MAHKKIQRQNTIDEIKSYARIQMGKIGPSGISMSAISRSMEISAPALYRYFDSRDDLIRSLIGDALEDFLSALQKAESGLLPADFSSRYWAVIMEYRNWALTHPTDFQLIFNNPCTKDQNVLTLTQPGIQRVYQVFAQILGDAFRAGKLSPLPVDSKSLGKVEFGSIFSVENQEFPAPVLYTGLVAWSRLHGLVMLELASGNTGPIDSQSAIYRLEVNELIRTTGLGENQQPGQTGGRQSKPAHKQVKTQGADELHVVFGGGPLGQAVMRELLARGKQVRVIGHSGKAGVPDGVELMVGDAFQVEFTRKACQNAAVVYQCDQPSNGNWLDRFAALNASILDGAAAKGAKFIYGDHLEVYGSVDGPIHEGLANKPQTRKGQVRARVSESILTAHRSGRVKAAIGRASDIFGPFVLEAVFGKGIFIPLLRGKTVVAIGDLEAAHTFTYIDDFGKALVELGERDEATGQIWHVPNAVALTQRQLMELSANEAGLPLKIRGTSRRMLAFQSLFSTTARERLDILYQFEKPFGVDSSKFEKAFKITATPLEEAVRQTVNWYRGDLK